MARTIFDGVARQLLITRLGRLTPGSERRFGTMTPSQMMCHLQDSIRCAMGEVPVRVRRSPMAHPVLRWLIIYAMPWPRGRAKTAREMLQTQPGEFEADRQRLAQLIGAAGERGAHAAWAPHPAFGTMSGRDYGALIHKHVDYHLKQFGV